MAGEDGATDRAAVVAFTVPDDDDNQRHEYEREVEHFERTKHIKPLPLSAAARPKAPPAEKRPATKKPSSKKAPEKKPPAKKRTKKRAAATAVAVAPSADQGWATSARTGPPLSSRATRLLALMFKVARPGDVLWSVPIRGAEDRAQEWIKTETGVSVSIGRDFPVGPALSRREGVLELGRLLAVMERLDALEHLWFGRALIVGVDVTTELAAHEPQMRARAALSGLREHAPAIGEEPRMRIETIVMFTDALLHGTPDRDRTVPSPGAALLHSLAGPARRARRVPEPAARLLRVLLDALAAQHTALVAAAVAAARASRADDADRALRAARHLEAAGPEAAALVNAFGAEAAALRGDSDD